MSDEIPLAAEYVLRLLDGEELLEARRRIAEDAAFAGEVAWWEERLAPLFDEIGEERPSAELWPRIVERLQGTGGEVVQLKRQVTLWRGASGALGIAAAVLLMLQLRPDAPQPAPLPAPRSEVPPAAPLLVASLAGTEAPEALTVAYRGDRRELIITPARIEAPAGRARQLWLIPEGGQPISLGLVASEGVQRRTLAPAVASRFASGGTIAVSDEPTGGSPTGQPTGAVLAAGGLASV